MGDKSPKSANKNAKQKATKAAGESEKKKQAIVAKQVGKGKP